MSIKVERPYGIPVQTPLKPNIDMYVYNITAAGAVDRERILLNFTFFLLDFGLREVSQWRDLEILLQMAFGRARDDFSKPLSGTGTITHLFVNNTSFIFSRESRPIVHLFEKNQFSKKLEYSTSSERCVMPWYVDPSNFH